MDINPTSDSPRAVALTIRSRAMLPRARETTRHAHQMGVKVIAGADSGYTSDDPHRLSDEMSELVGIGMPPMEAIKSPRMLASCKTTHRLASNPKQEPIPSRGDVTVREHCRRHDSLLKGAHEGISVWCLAYSFLAVRRIRPEWRSSTVSLGRPEYALECLA